MRCVSYCTAKTYHLIELSHSFKNDLFQIKFYRDVLHISHIDYPRADIFCFPQGCVVFWGLHTREELKLLKKIDRFADDPLEKPEMDSFSFCYSEETTIGAHDRFNLDIIELEANTTPIKLAISYGLAQSIRLAAFEETIKKTIEFNSSLAVKLAKKGRIALRGRAISKRMGEIFIERSSVNLNSEYLEMPEYFWKYSNLESYYLMVEKYLDVPRRVNALNRKLDVLHDIFEMLNDQLQHRYASILELIIIVLIMVEIFLTLFWGKH